MLNLHWNIPIVSDDTGVVPEGLNILPPPLSPSPRVRQVSMREIKQSQVGASDVLKIHGFIWCSEERKDTPWSLWRVLRNQLILKIGK